VLNHLRETLRISKQDEQFTLYSLNDDLDTYQPTLIICNPGDGQESSELTANIQLLTQTWEQDFYQKIVAAVESQMIIDEADNSPIMEMFKFVGIRSMFESTAPEKRIIVISDMVEHTSSYSQYTQSVDFQTLKDSPYFREVRPSLDNVDVEMLYIERPELAVIQRRRHITFWENLIDEAGGRITLVEPIN